MYKQRIAKLFTISSLVGIPFFGNSAGAGERDASGYLNDPCTRPGIITPYTLPEAWPVHLDRNPLDRSPENTDTRMVVLGTGMPQPNPYRSGPAYAVVANNQPYLVDAGEGIWRSLARAVLIHGDEMNMALAPIKLNYLFVTHLHEDHTVGIPSLILNPFKLNIPAPKSIYGPEGINEMVEHILAAWKIHIAAVLARIATEAKVKAVVLSHEQNYAAPEDFRRTGLKDEVIEAGYKGAIYSAMDGDVY